MMKPQIATTLFVVVSVLMPAVAGSEDCPILVGRSPGGTSHGVAAQGSMAYLANGASVDVIDLTDPVAPVVVGSVELPYSIRHLAHDDDRVYVMTRVHLHVIDVSDPSSPFEAGRLVFEGYHLDADGDLLVVQTDTGLKVFDVSSPATPTMVGTFPTGGSNDVKVAGSHAYLSNIGLQILDLSNPSNPTQIGQFALPGIGAIDVVGDTVYAVDEAQGFVVVDVTDPTAPVQLGNLDTVWGGNLAVHGNLAYLTYWLEGLQVVDVSDPLMPRLMGTAPDPPDESWGSVAAIAGHSLVVDWQRGLRVVDTTDPTAPTLAAGVDIPGYIEDAVHDDGTLYIAAFERGLRSVDVSDPLAPVELATLDLGGTADEVAVEDGLAVVVGWLFKVVDVGDPSSPSVIGEIPEFTGGRGVAVTDGLAYVANDEDGLHIVDISIPSVPVEIGSLDPGGQSWWSWSTVVVSDGHVFMNGFGSVEIIDVEDPTNPVSVASIPGTALTIALHRSLLLVGSNLDLRIFDVRDPTNPVEFDPYTTSGWIQNIGVSGSVAYLGIQLPGQYNTYIEVVDMGDPASPAAMGQYVGAGFPAPGFTFDQRMAYSFSTYSGFDSFALCQGPIFADGFETGDTTAWSIAASGSSNDMRARR